MTSTITVIILTKNEEENIKDCIATVQFADEVLVIDDFSTDHTVPFAKTLGARCVQHALDGDWGKQRRFGISQAKSDWIVFLDADERVSPELAAEMVQAVQTGELKAYWLRRFNRFCNNKATHGVLRPDKVLRLIPKDGASAEGFVHETIRSPYPRATLRGKLYHHTYTDWRQYFNKFNSYTTAAAKKYQSEGKECSFFKDIIFRPSWAFFKMYILDRGFLDGRLGFILSVYHYFYTMTKYVKLYYLLKDNGKL